MGRLERRLEAWGQAIGDFGLIEPGDRILVGVSGGKPCALATASRPGTPDG